VISAGRATLAELQTVYSVEDVYEMIEIVMVDAENERRASAAAEAGAG
jgi:hypothetical protein